MTGEWLAHCNACPVPEIANVFNRARIPFPTEVAWGVAGVQLVGGAFVLMGLFSRVWGVLMATIVAALFVMTGMPVIKSGGVRAFFHFTPDQSNMVFAQLGLFVLANGNVGGRQIVPPDWFDQATRKQKDIGQPGRGYGFQWWTYDDGSFAAQGIYGQGIFIDPKRRLVIASNSNWTRATLGPEPKAREAFYAAVRAAVDR